MEANFISEERFFAERAEVLNAWPTGKDVDLKEAVHYHENIPSEKKFTQVLKEADSEGRVLVQPRAGVALVDEHIALLQKLETEADLLPTTIDAYTRLNHYDEAQKGIERSLEAGHSLLNGFPAVNHGVKECRRVVESLKRPLQVRHGTPDARLLAEITLAAGFTSFEGGGISYNIPYAKKVPLELSLKAWQYVDRLCGYYEEKGVRINREPFGPLTGSLVPPCISTAVAILEGLLALEQGVRCITLGYGQLGNLVQDVAAIVSLRELSHEYFQKYNFSDYQLTTVFHQWMGGFPEDEAKAFAVISWGSAIAALSKATKVIVKTPHEARGIPTAEANLQGIKATKQVVNMLAEQVFICEKALQTEIDLIKEEVRTILDNVIKLGEGDLVQACVRAFSGGLIDVPFAPSRFNKGKIMPVRDSLGAVRILDWGNIPATDNVKAYHRELIEKRGQQEGRKPSYHMLIDDVYAVSKGRLVGHPRA
ncbi:methylaspartate mutase subunit E [bacterium]|nr:methylaspartate mutase subunit E [bacterium]